MKRPAAGGGWPAVWYTLRQARASGGVVRMWRALRARNACKTCALGMGGQRGGMVNEAGHFPEVCKKSVQAMAADMRGRVRPGFFDEFGFDRLGRLSSRELEQAGRLVEPLMASPGDRGYREVGWDEALGRVADELAAIRRRGEDASGPMFYVSGRSSNEAAFLLQLLARAYGTNNVNNCSYFCHQASGVALKGMIGSGTATVTLDDLGGSGGADLIYVIGGNPASNHPRLMSTLLAARRRGASIVVVNPLRELGLVRFKVPSDVRSMLSPGGSAIASHYVQPNIGGDAALFAGVAKALIALDGEWPGGGVIDRAYIDAHTEGYEAFRAGIEAMEWAEIEAGSGVARAEIENLARLYAASKRTIFAWTMGITHHAHGVDNARMIAAVALMRGMVGREGGGAGLLPLRGHSNVQGVGSMGVEPALRPAMRSAIRDRFAIDVPDSPGLDTLASIEAAHEGRIRFAWHLGGNLYGSAPDAAYVTSAMSRVDTTVFLSTALNTGHIHGRGRTSIILPVLARDEEPQATTQESMFSYVRLSEGGRARVEGPEGPPPSEVGVISRVFRRVLGDRVGELDLVALSSHDEIRRTIAACVPGYGAIAGLNGTRGERRTRSGLGRGEFLVEGRRFGEPSFATPGGRAVFPSAPKLPAPAAGGELRVMTIRSEGQFNTVVYEDDDFYRGQERRDVILMNGADIGRLGLKVDERVHVRSDAGEMRDILVREGELPPGNAAMYYPEANALVPREADGESRTPAFKSVRVRVERSGALPVIG